MGGATRDDQVIMAAASLVPPASLVSARGPAEHVKVGEVLRRDDSGGRRGRAGRTYGGGAWHGARGLPSLAARNRTTPEGGRGAPPPGRAGAAAARCARPAAGVPRLPTRAPARAGPAALLAGGVNWLVVNEGEAAAVLGRGVAGLAAAGAAARDLRALGARRAVVTAGSHGAALAGPAEDEVIAALSVRSVDSVGAGDAFVAALAVALAAGVPPADAGRAASAAGATPTTRRGTQDALPRPADIPAATGLAWPAGPGPRNLGAFHDRGTKPILCVGFGPGSW